MTRHPGTCTVRYVVMAATSRRIRIKQFVFFNSVLLTDNRDNLHTNTMVETPLLSYITLNYGALKLFFHLQNFQPPVLGDSPHKGVHYVGYPILLPYMNVLVIFKCGL